MSHLRYAVAHNHPHYSKYTHAVKRRLGILYGFTLYILFQRVSVFERLIMVHGRPAQTPTLSLAPASWRGGRVAPPPPAPRPYEF